MLTLGWGRGVLQVLNQDMNHHGGHGEERFIKDCGEHLIDAVLTCVINVHRHLGPGLFESVYELATMVELEQAQILANARLKSQYSVVVTIWESALESIHRRRVPSLGIENGR